MLLRFFLINKKTQVKKLDIVLQEADSRSRSREREVYVNNVSLQR